MRWNSSVIVLIQVKGGGPIARRVSDCEAKVREGPKKAPPADLLAPSRR
jgi:hypothetical protein